MLPKLKMEPSNLLTNPGLSVRAVVLRMFEFQGITRAHEYPRESLESRLVAELMCTVEEVDAAEQQTRVRSLGTGLKGADEVRAAKHAVGTAAESKVPPTVGQTLSIMCM